MTSPSGKAILAFPFADDNVDIDDLVAGLEP